MGDHPIALLAEVQHLSVPVVRGERPPVTEHYGLAFSPVLVVNPCAVFCGDRGHGIFSFLTASGASAEQRVFESRRTHSLGVKPNSCKEVSVAKIAKTNNWARKSGLLLRTRFFENADYLFPGTRIAKLTLIRGSVRHFPFRLT